MARHIFIVCLVISMFTIVASNGQNIRLYASPNGAAVLDVNNDTLLNPWCPGWLYPQFSNIDLNGDGQQDLFVFVPGYGDDRVLTFINIGNGKYQYYPEYESLFPKMSYWALLVDYNKDGKPDIFTYSNEGGAIDVYKNISDSSGIKFVKATYSKDPLKDYICFMDGTFPLNVYVLTTDIPAIGDFDGDGDIDILAFDPSQQGALFYKNMAVENGWSLDSIHFNFTNPSRCWGKFNQLTGSPPVGLHFGCGPPMKKHQDGGCSMLAVDMDNDGDLDILLGNRFSDGLAQLMNGRITNGKVITKNDSITLIEPAISGTTRTVGLAGYTGAFLADGTQDNVKDLIVAPVSPATDTPSHKTYLYRNEGKAAGNHFTYITDNFLQETMLNTGEHAAPAFVDFNGDGLMDLVMATQGNTKGAYAYDHLELYKNIGTSKKAVYKKADDNFASLARFQLAWLAPTFADIDGDGRQDMLLGRKDGRIMYFKNMADSGGSLQMKLVSDFYAGIDAGGYSTPCLGHISSDTLFDLVVGRDSGTIRYYKNTGKPTAPDFKKVTDSFGNVRTNVFYWGNYVYNSKGQVVDSSYLMQTYGRSAPVLTDIDHDGKLDLVSGSTYGEMFFWFDIKSHLKGTFVRTDTVFYNTLIKKKENKYLGFFTLPAAADLDGDGYPDMLIGNGIGGIQYYGSQRAKLGIDEPYLTDKQVDIAFDVFPNPATRTLYIRIRESGFSQASLSVTNTMGSVLKSCTVSNGTSPSEIDISGLAPGLYFAVLRDGKGRIGAKKIVVQ